MFFRSHVYASGMKEKVVCKGEGERVLRSRMGSAGGGAEDRLRQQSTSIETRATTSSATASVALLMSPEVDA